MAHGEKTVAASRVVPIEDNYGRHDQEGRHYEENSVLAHDGRKWFAVRDAREHGQFHLRLAKSSLPARYSVADSDSISGYVYRPLHPSMTAQDIEGATYAHDDGTHWLFAHCSPHEQIDFAAEVESYLRTALQPAIDTALAKLGGAKGSNKINTTKAKADAFVKFAFLAGRDAHARVVQATLGHWHRDPHNDHRRDLSILAMEAILAYWDEEGKEDTDAGRQAAKDRTAVKAEVDATIARLKQEPEIEWRHVRQKRLDDAAAAKGTDPVAGYEYCYTQSVFPRRITAAADLPLAGWPFDGLRSGRVLRGSYFYSDGEPTVNRFLPWVFRFKRPIPEGTQPGAAVNIPWEQETAYKPAPPAEGSGA